MPFLIAQNDTELWDWLLGASHPVAGAGSFVRALAEAALHADSENYGLLRPLLLTIKAKYPQYGPVGRALQKG